MENMQKVNKRKINFFQKELLSWYKINGRKFPWRNKGLSHYQLVIAETLLQRTKAETVSKFYKQFIKDFPNWQTLAKANTKSLEKYLMPIGLYKQRSKRLKSLAIEMVKRKGRLPKDRVELESIPFMGQYIANAVELIIFNQPSPLIDVNMARVLERFFGAREMADIRYDPYLQELSYKIVDHVEAKVMNWAVLDFAAKVCKARNPDHEKCLLKKDCIYFKNLL